MSLRAGRPRPGSWAATTPNSWTRIGAVNRCKSPSTSLGAPSPPTGRKGWDEVVRFMSSLHSFRARIGTMNRQIRGARTAMSASALRSLHTDMAVRAPTDRFMESLDFNFNTHWDIEGCSGVSMSAVECWVMPTAVTDRCDRARCMGSVDWMALRGKHPI